MDNFIRPILIRQGADLPLLLIFAGVLGGLFAFGIVGLFVGPVVLAVTYTLLTDWVNEGESAASEDLVARPGCYHRLSDFDYALRPSSSRRCPRPRARRADFSTSTAITGATSPSRRCLRCFRAAMSSYSTTPRSFRRAFTERSRRAVAPSS
jgi:hypothetical protein